MSMKKIGVLLPHSNAYPRMSKDFMNGLQLSSTEKVEFKVAGIGFANDATEIINAIQKLINQEDIDLLTGLVGHNNLNEILNFVQGMELPFIFADLGAKCPLDIGARKNIWCNSLDLYSATQNLGNYFVQKGIHKIGISTSYYDAGYDFTFAMETVMQKNPTLQFAGHFITPLQPRENESQLMRQFFDQVHPDVIFGFHNGVFAQEHALFLEKSELTKKTPIYVTPFSINENPSSETKNTFDQQFCISPWYPELDTPENKSFQEAYVEKYNSGANFIALLGFENALLIQDFFNKGLDSNAIASIGPRGSMHIDETYNRTLFNHYLWQFVAKENGYQKILVETFEIKDQHLENNTQISRSGWENAYLCH